MFLDDELYQIGQQVNTRDLESVKLIIRRMINVCVDRVNSQTTKDRSTRNYLATIQRIDTQWRQAVTKLNKAGLDFVKPDGWKLYIESQGAGLHKNPVD